MIKIKEFSGYEEIDNTVYMCYKSNEDKYILSYNRLNNGDIVEGGEVISIYGVKHILV